MPRIYVLGFIQALFPLRKGIYTKFNTNLEWSAIWYEDFSLNLFRRNFLRIFTEQIK